MTTDNPNQVASDHRGWEDMEPQPPQRIQMSRRKGHVKPQGAIYVGRPTRYGNPWKVGENGLGAAECVELYSIMLAHSDNLRHRAEKELRGRDLACWCPLDQPCHADVLLEVVNG